MPTIFGNAEFTAQNWNVQETINAFYGQANFENDLLRGNIVYEKAVFRVRDDVSVGYPLNIAMRQVNLFPHMVIQMTAIGEEAGALDTMLYKVAEFYEQEVNNAVDALASLITSGFGEEL